MQTKKHIAAGFTLIELLVVLVIMSLITLAFINNQSKFDSATLMRALAYQVALSVRQTQVYGTSVIQNSSGSSNFGPTFGISFGNSTNSYFIFSDPTLPPGGELDTGVIKLKTFTVQNTFIVHEVCLVSNEGTANWYCSSKQDGTNTTDDSTAVHRLDVINVLVKRPNPDALFAAYNAGAAVTPPVSKNFINAYIQVRAINGDSRVVKVSLTGQVSVCGVGSVSTNTGVTIARLKTGAASC